VPKKKPQPDSDDSDDERVKREKELWQQRARDRAAQALFD